MRCSMVKRRHRMTVAARLACRLQLADPAVERRQTALLATLVCRPGCRPFRAPGCLNSSNATKRFSGRAALDSADHLGGRGLE